MIVLVILNALVGVFSMIAGFVGTGSKAVRIICFAMSAIAWVDVLILAGMV